MQDLDFTKLSSWDVIPGDVILIQGQFPRIRTVDKVGEVYSPIMDTSKYLIQLSDGQSIDPIL